MKFNSLKELDVFDQDRGSQSARRVISLSAASCGRASGALELAAAFESGIKELGLADQVELKLTGCHGFCQLEPDVLIFPERYFYPKVKAGEVKRILQETGINGRFIPELGFQDDQTGKLQPGWKNCHFIRVRFAG